MLLRPFFLKRIKVVCCWDVYFSLLLLPNNKNKKSPLEKEIFLGNYFIRGVLKYEGYLARIILCNKRSRD